MRRFAFALAALLAVAPLHAQTVSIMHGFADMANMTLWLQTERAARVAVELHADGEATKRRRVEGATRAEAIANIKEAIAGYLESLDQHGEPVPPSISEEVVEVDV